jgi:hypothetical protein
MSVNSLSHVEYEERNGVGVWTVTDFAASLETGELEEGEAHYRDVASKDRMDATVVVIENADQVGTGMGDTLDHINQQWSQLADEVNIDRLAYVADGLMASVVKSNIDADVDTESFKSLDEALDWAGA